MHLLALAPLALLGGLLRKSPRSTLLLMDVNVGRLQHLSHQGHELVEVHLSISIRIQLLEDLVNGGLIFGVLGEGTAETMSSDSARPFSRPLAPRGSAEGGPGILMNQCIRVEDGEKQLWSPLALAWTCPVAGNPALPLPPVSAAG